MTEMTYKTIADIPPEFQLVDVDFLVSKVLEQIGYDGPDDYGLLFVRTVDNLPYPSTEDVFKALYVAHEPLYIPSLDGVEEVYGAEGIVPYLHKPLDKLYPKE